MTNKTILDEKASRDRSIFLVGLLVIIFCALLLATISRLNHSLTLDEPFTAYHVNHTISQMLALMWDNIQQPLYYVLLRPWRVIFGESEFALRAPSIILFCAAIVVTSLAGRKLYGTLAGLLAGALVAFSSMGLHYAATARPYILAMFLVALYCWIAILWMLGEKKERSLLNRRDSLFILILGVIGALGLLSHIIFVFTLAAFTLAAVLLSWRHAFRFALASLVATILFLLLWGAYFIRGLSLPSLNAFYRIPGFAELLAGYGNMIGQKKSLVLLAAVLLLIALQWRTVFNFFKQRSNLFLGFVVILSVLLPVIISQVKQVYVATRTPIIGLPVAALLLSGLLILFKRRWLLAGLILILAATALYFSVTQWLYPDQAPFKNQVATVLQESECGDMIVSVGITEGEVSYYLRTLHAPDCLVHETFPAEMRDNPWILDLANLPQEQHPQLKAEAQSLIHQAVKQDAKQIWVFAPSRFSTAILTEIFKEEADHSLKLVEEVAGHGTFNDVLLRYEAQ